MDEKKEKNVGVVYGIALIIATTVGGGMFSLPVALENVWFVKGCLILLGSALLMLLTGLMLVEVNLKFPSGTSFHTFTKQLLGPGVSVVIGISLTFVLYLITYAYISGASSALSDVVQFVTGFSPGRYAILAIVLVVAAIAWKGGILLGRVVSFLVAGKFTAFFATFTGVLPHVTMEKLGYTPPATHFSELFFILPFCIISFGFHGTVPTLVKLYHRSHAEKIVKALCWGVALSLLIYVFWLVITMGILSKQAIQDVMANGGNIGAFLQAFRNDADALYIKIIILIFANFAVTASLLSATAGLSDYIKDLLRLGKDGKSRGLAVLITYAPPAILCALFPDGFIPAMAYAGIALTIWSVLLPPLLVLKARKTMPQGGYRVPCNSAALILVLLFGVITFVTMMVIAIRG